MWLRGITKNDIASSINDPHDTPTANAIAKMLCKEYWAIISEDKSKIAILWVPDPDGYEYIETVIDLPKEVSEFEKKFAEAFDNDNLQTLEPIEFQIEIPDKYLKLSEEKVVA